MSGAAGEVGDGPVGVRPAAFAAYGQPGFLRLEITPDALTVWAYTVAPDGTVTTREATRIKRG